MYSLHVLHGELEKRIEAVLIKKEDLSLSQYLVLVGLSGEESSLSQAKLAERLRLTEATVSRHIGILVKRKLLVRKKEEHDKKSYSISLSPLGFQVFQKTEETILDLVEEYFKVVTEKEKNETTSVLQKIITRLEANN